MGVWNMLMSNDYFKNFKWPMPKEFNEALRCCRFDVGDRLYDHVSAYDEWNNGPKPFKYLIEVIKVDGEQLPKNSDEEPTEAETKKIFLKNWKTPLDIKLTSFVGGELNSKEIKTTHGRLYYSMWHGGLTYLDLDTFSVSSTTSIRSTSKPP